MSLKYKSWWRNKLGDIYVEFFVWIRFPFLQYPQAVQSWETKIISVLLDNEADPNIKDSKGETALHQAVYVNKPETATIATSLLEFGGNIEETTKVTIFQMEFPSIWNRVF